MSMFKKLFSKKYPDGVVDVEEHTQGSKKKKSFKHNKKDNKKEEQQYQPNFLHGDARGDVVAQEDDDGISKASEAASEYGYADGEAEQTLNPEAAAAAAKPANSDAEAGKLEHGGEEEEEEEEEGKVVEQVDAPVERTVTVIEESRVRVSEGEDSSAAAASVDHHPPPLSGESEADKAVDSGKIDASPTTAEATPRATSVAHRATWWNCCGILDVFVGS